MKSCASLLAALCFLSAAHASEPVRKFHNGVKTLTDTTVMFGHDDRPASSIALEMRCAVPHSDKNREGVALIWKGPEATMEAWLIKADDGAADTSYPARTDFVLLRHGHDGKSETIARRSISSGTNAANRFITFGLEIEADGSATVYAGEKEPADIFTLPPTHSFPDSLGVKARGKADVDFLLTEYTPDPAARLMTGHSAESLHRHMVSIQPNTVEGVWTYLDRDTDERSMRLGGTYTIAIVRNDSIGRQSPESFDIIYIEGAKVGNDTWQTGMKKGRLTATLFQNHYNLSWICADLTEIANECSATMNGDKSIISFNFPIYGSTVRFSRHTSEPFSEK